MATSHQFDKEVHKIGQVQYVEDLKCPACFRSHVLMFGLQYQLLQICPDCEYTVHRYPILDDAGQDRPGHVLTSLTGKYDKALAELAKYNIRIDDTGQPQLIDSKK